MLDFSISIPGSIILLGEHAVLKGYPCVACAVNKRLIINFKKRNDDQIKIFSELGQVNFLLKNLAAQKPFEFLLESILVYKAFLKSGFELTVNSEFSSQVGLGSSAAITVGVLATLQYFLFGKLNQKELYEEALKVVRKIQKRGSGYDIAASIFGGIFDYQCDPFVLNPIQTVPNLALIYSGYKTPTAVVLEKISWLEKNNPAYYQKNYQAIGDCVKKSMISFKNSDWENLGEIFNEEQFLLKSLGVSDATLDDMVVRVLKLPNVLGAKISGAGLGDCVVVLLKNTHEKLIFPSHEVINVRVEGDGVKIIL